MKVAIFTNNYLPRTSGVSVAVDFLNRTLQLTGHQPFIIAPDYGFFAHTSSSIFLRSGARSRTSCFPMPVKATRSSPPTDPIREHLASVGAKAPVATVPTGLEASRFGEVVPADIESLRSQFGLDRFDTVLLSVGRITKEKNVDLSLAALDELLQRGHNCGRLIFGEGPEGDNPGRTYTHRYRSLVRTGRRAGRTKRKLFKELVEEITDRNFFLTPG